MLLFFLPGKLSVVSGPGKLQNRTRDQDYFFTVTDGGDCPILHHCQGAANPAGLGGRVPQSHGLSQELPGPTYVSEMSAIKGTATFFQKESYSSGSGGRRGDDSQLYFGAVVFTVSSVSNISSLGLHGAKSSSHMKCLRLPRFMFWLPNLSLLMGAESN